MSYSPSQELVWIVDEKNSPLGGVTRAEMRQKRLIHRSTYILITDPKERLLLQKRTNTKDVYPGLWEIAAGGVVAYKEDYLNSAIRELQEETGISNVPLRQHLDFYYEDQHNRLWGRLFSCSWNGTIHPQAEEVEKAFFASKDVLWDMLTNEKFTPDSYFLIELIKRERISPFDRLFSP